MPQNVPGKRREAGGLMAEQKPVFGLILSAAIF